MHHFGRGMTQEVIWSSVLSCTLQRRYISLRVCVAQYHRVFRYHIARPRDGPDLASRGTPHKHKRVDTSDVLVAPPNAETLLIFFGAVTPCARAKHVHRRLYCLARSCNRRACKSAIILDVDCCAVWLHLTANVCPLFQRVLQW